MKNMFESMYQEITSLQDLKPNIHTNTVFSKLYKAVIWWEFSGEYCEHKKHLLQNTCSRAEYEMEKYYAEKIINSELKIEDFIYIDNYEKLVELEIHALKNFWKIPQKMLYIWGGPLPLTAIWYAQIYDVKITILDNSLEAISLGKKVIQSLWLEHKIDYRYWDASNYDSDEKYDFISVASLVFTHTNLENILQNLQKFSFKTLLLRSSDGARELLYKKLPLHILEKYFKIVFQHHPKDEIINSIILLKKYE